MKMQKVIIIKFIKQFVIMEDGIIGIQIFLKIIIVIMFMKLDSVNDIGLKNYHVL